MRWFTPATRGAASACARATRRWQSTGIGGISDGASPDVFHRHIKRVQRDAAALNPGREEFAQLREEVSERLVERLLDTTRKFPIAADMGCWDGQVLKRIAGNIGGITTLHQCDSSQAMLDLCREGNVGGVAASRLLVDDETEFPFERESLDLVISNLSLHWINDIPGAMVRAREALRPDGLFLASMFGGNTLNELRCAMAVAELERDGGISSHVSPMAGISDAGSLLGRAGFTIPAVDSDTIVVQFPSAMDVMHTLQAMGENNAGVTRRPFVSKDTMLAAAAVYEAMYGGDEGVPATFQVMYLSGWAPHATQQQPKTRGTAKFSLAEIGDVNILDDQPPAGSGSPIVAPWAQAAKSPLDTSREK